jgi:hypothetical protein
MPQSCRILEAEALLVAITCEVLIGKNHGVQMKCTAEADALRLTRRTLAVGRWLHASESFAVRVDHGGFTTIGGLVNQLYL